MQTVPFPSRSLTFKWQIPKFVYLSINACHSVVVCFEMNAYVWRDLYPLQSNVIYNVSESSGLCWFTPLVWACISLCWYGFIVCMWCFNMPIAFYLSFPYSPPPLRHETDTIHNIIWYFQFIIGTNLSPLSICSILVQVVMCRFAHLTVLLSQYAIRFVFEPISNRSSMFWAQSTRATFHLTFKAYLIQNKWYTYASTTTNWKLWIMKITPNNNTEI